MQTDGNLVAYNTSGVPYWATNTNTNTNGYTNAVLMIRNDQAMVVYPDNSGSDSVNVNVNVNWP
jgi:hypothetical protein